MNVEHRHHSVPAPAAHPLHAGVQLRRNLLAVMVAACYSTASANPAAPQVAAGQATFNQQGNLFSITNTPNTIINWQSFSIKPDEITRFIQQNADSKVLNRITGQDPSQILGALQSNGKVFLINPNGVLFGKDARVDVNGLVASSLALTNADFLAGRNNYGGAGSGAGKVSNQGTIITPAGGQVYLIAPSVENIGLINSPNGEVLLAAGQSVQLVDSANPDVHVVVSAPADAALNLGQIVAQGGRVGIYGALVSQRGTVNANSAVRGANGNIVLKASGTTMLEAGSRTTAVNSADGGKGGSIQLLGKQVGLTGDAQVDASGAGGGGTVLVGGDYQGRNAAVPNAQQTYVGAESSIKADALVNGAGRGDGGKVVVWSDNATRMYGALSARGGAAGGNGGMIEASGHNYLDMLGSADTSAARGKSGTLLLDPTDIYIAIDRPTANAAAGVSVGLDVPVLGDIFQEVLAGATSLLTTGRLSALLDNSDVTVNTANILGTGGGSINVVSPVSWTGSKSLTLHATTDININAAVGNSSAIINLTADNGNIAQTAPLTAAALNATAGGNIGLANTSNVLPLVTLSAGGNASLYTSGALDVDPSSVTGSLTLHAHNSLTQSAAFSAGTLSAISDTGNIALTDSGNVINGHAALSAPAGSAALTAASFNMDASSSNGAMTLTANSGTLATSGTLQSGGAMTLTASSGTLSTGGALQSGGTLLLKADDMALGGTLSGAGQGVQIRSYSSNRNIVLGTGANSSSGTLNLSDTELQGVTHGVLQVGGSGSSGAITVAGNLNLSGLPSSVIIGDSGASGNVTVNSGVTLTAPHVISLLTNPAGTARVTNQGAIVAEQIDIFAAKMSLSGGTLTAGNVSLSTSNDIDLGAVTDAGGKLVLGAGDLASVHAENLDISINPSNSGTGNIVISQALNVTRGLSLSARNQVLPGAGVAVTVGGEFALNGGDWVQNAAAQSSTDLPTFSAGGFSVNNGATFLRVKGGSGSIETPYQLTDIYGLQGAGSLNLSNSYILAQDIAAAGTINWNGGDGFKPLGDSDHAYSGVFNGNNKAISDLYINRDSNNVGLFSYVAAGTIKNLTLAGGSISGDDHVGAIVGQNTGNSLLQNVRSSANVNGGAKVGGLMGNNAGTVLTSSSSGNVSGSSAVGGLVGYNDGTQSTPGLIAGSSASGTVIGADGVGGLVGENVGGSISESFADAPGSVSGVANVGGLVGNNNNGSIQRSYASGAVAGGGNTGGFVGVNTGSITDAYATGSVSGSAGGTGENLGGFAGSHDAGSITNAYSTGRVDGGGYIDSGTLGGFVGLSSGAQTHTYWDREGSQQDFGGAGVTNSYTSSDMQQEASFGGFDFSSSPVWRIYEGHTTPLLKSLLKPLTANVTGGGDSKEYDNDHNPYPFFGTLVSYTGLGDGDTISGTLSYENAVNVGNYSVGGLWSTKYDISYSGNAGVLQITPRTLTATISGTKVYNANTDFSGFSYELNGLANGEMDNITLSASASFVNKDVGSNKPLVVNGALEGNVHGNYTLGSVGGAASITPASLIVGGLSGVNKVYDSTTKASLAGTPTVTPFSGDIVTVSGNGVDAGHFADKNVNASGTKAITVNNGSYVLAGHDKDNYAITYSSELSASITPAPLSITGMSADNKVYDAKLAATISGGTLVGKFAGDDLTFNGASARFDTKGVGNDKLVTLTSVNLTGDDRSNYGTPVVPLSFTANITPATLSFSGVERQFNGNANVALALNGVASDEEHTADAVTLLSSSASYADKNVGTGKPITITAYSIDGADAGNYVVNTGGAVGNIIQRPNVHWLATGSGNWSDPANWTAGIVPDGLGNVGEVILDGSGTVTYGAASGISSVTKITGSTGQNLLVSGGSLTVGLTHADTSSLAGGSMLTISGGSLTLKGDTTLGQYTQSDGVLSGSGNNLIQFSGTTFAQTGGSIDISGSLAIAHSGNLVLGNIRATNGITISNSGDTSASVTQAAGSALRTNSLAVNTSSSGNADITLTNSGNQVYSFQATGGNIALTNVTAPSQLLLKYINASGNLSVDNTGGIDTLSSDGNITAGGMLSLTAHSPITIRNHLQANDMALSASTNISLAGSGGLVSAHNIGITAGTGVSLASGSSVSATNSVGITAGNGITLDGAVSGGSISAVATTGAISASGSITSPGQVQLTALTGSVTAPASVFSGGTQPVISDGAAAAAAADAAAKAAADAAAKAAADAAAKAAADAAAKAAADAAAKAAADAAAKAAADAAAADAAAKAAADAAAKAAADAAAKAAADAAAKAAADAAAKAAADAAADAAAKAAADAAAKAAADAAAQAAADAAAKAAADAAAKAAAAAAAKAAADAAAAAAAQGQQNQPVAQAINSTVNIINTAINATTPASGGANPAVVKPVADATLVASSGGSAGSGGSGATGGPTKTDDKKEDKKDDKKDDTALASKDSGVKKDEPVKKMYCN
jgi:filamentous hemagglutinin family protein